MNLKKGFKFYIVSLLVMVFTAASFFAVSMIVDTREARAEGISIQDAGDLCYLLHTDLNGVTDWKGHRRCVNRLLGLVK